MRTFLTNVNHVEELAVSFVGGFDTRVKFTAQEIDELREIREVMGIVDRVDIAK